MSCADGELCPPGTSCDLSRHLCTSTPAASPPPGGETIDTDIEYYHLDALASVRMVTNRTGAVIARYDYLPFGEEIPPSAAGRDQVPGYGGISSTRRFTGKERDVESGLDYFGARYYGSRIGRFSTVDPADTFKENLVDPQRWNKYAYARNNPLKYVDPDGRQMAPGQGYLIGQGWTTRSVLDPANWGTPAMAVQYMAVTAGILLVSAAPALIAEAPALVVEAQIASASCSASAVCMSAASGILESASGAPPGAMGTLPAFGASTIATAVESAAETGRYSVPRGLRMLASHVDRGDPAFAGVEKSLESAEGIIRNILQNPTRVAGGRVTVDAYNSAGQGVRVEIETGRFVTFLDASKATR
jgi:RHS repeat-associated protein